MSLMDCHAVGVSSIVLEKAFGALLRVFLAWESHQLHLNQSLGTAVVGAHDHRTAINLNPLYGDVFNSTYEELDRGKPIGEWEFSSAIAGHSKVRFKRDTSLSLVECRRLVSEIHVPRYAIHTVHVASPMAAWSVRESSTRPRSTTRLFSDHMPNIDGMYRRFTSASDVRDHVLEFVARVGGSVMGTKSPQENPGPNREPVLPPPPPPKQKSRHVKQRT